MSGIRAKPEVPPTREELPDGTAILVRPIRPGDEPAWLDLLASCSAESIYARFQSFYPWRAPGTARRFCSPEAGEVALVAERPAGEGAGLLGVGRLVPEGAPGCGEYALLVRDEWQNRGVGGVLTGRCLAIAARLGLRRVVSRTTTDNGRMLTLLRRHGFVISRPGPGGEAEGVWAASPEGS